MVVTMTPDARHPGGKRRHCLQALHNSRTLGYELVMLLKAFVLDKALYELHYELNNRLDWLRIPLQSVLRLLEIYI